MDNIIVATFEVLGDPQGKGRPRFTKSGHAFTPEKTRTYERAVADAAAAAMNGHEPVLCEVHADIIAIYGIPKNTSKKKRLQMLAGDIKPTKKPDTDNVAKAILDGINGIVYRDDAQVTELHVRKIYGAVAKVVVWISAQEEKGE